MKIKMVFITTLTILATLNLFAQCSKTPPNSGNTNSTNNIQQSQPLQSLNKINTEKKLREVKDELSKKITDYYNTHNCYPDLLLEASDGVKIINVVTNKPIKQVEFGTWSPGDFTYLVSPKCDGFFIALYHFDKEREYLVDHKGVFKAFGYCGESNGPITVIDKISGKIFSLSMTSDSQYHIKPK